MPFQINTTSCSVGVIACLLAVSAHAAPNYRCTIEKRINAAPELPAVQMAQEKAYIGKRFMVERKTGIITGALQNAFTVDPEVVDSGSGNSAYKVVSIIKSDEAHIYGSNIYALTINEHANSTQKPFAFLENTVVYMGQCEHV
ncbi:MAG TPA: hypothetical protein VIN38_03635 [Thiobacillus sp.]